MHKLKHFRARRPSFWTGSAKWWDGRTFHELSRIFYVLFGRYHKKEVLLEVVETCHRHFGEVEILLNTAGILDAYHPLLETDEALWNRIFAVNVKACIV